MAHMVGGPGGIQRTRMTWNVSLAGGTGCPSLTSLKPVAATLRWQSHFGSGRAYSFTNRPTETVQIRRPGWPTSQSRQAAWDRLRRNREGSASERSEGVRQDRVRKEADLSQSALMQHGEPNSMKAGLGPKWDLVDLRNGLAHGRPVRGVLVSQRTGGLGEDHRDRVVDYALKSGDGL